MNMEKIGIWSDAIKAFLTQDVRDWLHEASMGPISGKEYIFFQIREMFIMAVCGACIAFFFEVYESTSAGKRAREKPSAVSGLLDLLFCIMAGFIAARFLYISSYGRISFHEIAALIGGIATGRIVFAFKNSKPVRTIAVVYVIMLITAYIIIV